MHENLLKAAEVLYMHRHAFRSLDHSAASCEKRMGEAYY